MGDPIKMFRTTDRKATPTAKSILDFVDSLEAAVKTRDAVNQALGWDTPKEEPDTDDTPAGGPKR